MCWRFNVLIITLHIDVVNLVGYFFTMAQQLPVSQDLLIIEDSRSLSDTPQSVGLLWMSEQPDAQTWQHKTLTTDTHTPEVFELAIQESELPQTHAFDRAASGIGGWL
jgi:hypothetical protein